MVGWDGEVSVSSPSRLSCHKFALNLFPIVHMTGSLHCRPQRTVTSSYSTDVQQEIPKSRIKEQE